MEGQQGREAEREGEVKKKNDLEPRLPFDKAAGKGEGTGGSSLNIFRAMAAQLHDAKTASCSLAWLVFNGEATASALSSFGAKMFAGSAVRRELSSRGGVCFPFKLGPLVKLKDVILKLSPHEVVALDFVHEFYQDCGVLISLAFLNSLSGGPIKVEAGAWNGIQRSAVQAIRSCIARSMELGGSVHRTPVEVEKELSDRFLSYTGEEVPKMQALSYDQVVSALPPKDHGGSIDICRLVSGRTNMFLRDPSGCILIDDGRELPKLQAKVHFQENEKLRVANLLVERNICTWRPYSEVMEYRGQKVLNGLFAVGKGAYLPDGREIQRCIMNLIPSNSVLMKLEGAVKKLPNICQWLSITLEDEEELKFYQSDMSSAFYLFHLPPEWETKLAFNLVVQPHEIGLRGTQPLALCCRVLPMGWASAVGVMQEVADKLTEIGNLPEACKVERTRLVPTWMTDTLKQANSSHSSWFHVYLDNFCAAEKVVKNAGGEEGRQLHAAIEEAWEQEGVLSSAKKRVREAETVHELGAYVGGKDKMLGPSGERIVKLIQTTLVVIGHGKLKRKWVQLLAGRWVHVLQFRRPGMVCLNMTWSYISGKKGGFEVEAKVRHELLLLAMGWSFWHTHLGAKISEVTTASDASSTGGAVGAAYSLTEMGCSFLSASRSLEGSPVPVVPVLVLSLFNGIGGAFRAYDVAGVAPLVLIGYDVHKPANRVCSRRWPQAILERDVRTCTVSKMREWLYAYPGVKAIHLWAGFPCTDLSSAKAFRRNLSGEQSGLFYEVKRILHDLRKVFGTGFEIRFICENVSSMDVDAEQQITRELGRKPFFMNSDEAVPIQRPRFCWTNVDCEPDIEDTYKEVCSRSVWIHLKAKYPDDSQWLTEGCWRTPGTIYPTAMKSIVRERPPPKPIGVHRCSADTLQRWEADDFRYPPYQYMDHFIIWREDKWRVLSADEREILHGYGAGHTSLCLSASDIKRSPTAYEDERKSLLGDSFSIFSFCYFAAQACRKYVEPLGYKQMVLRMGMAPGFAAPRDEIVPLSREVRYGNKTLVANPTDFHREMLRRINHTGSDVRVSAGTVMNPRAFPRQSVQAGWWNWSPLFAYKWKKSEHINSLELRSIIHSIQWRIRHLKEIDSRVFHLTDSYICMSVISKGRSSSLMLNRLLRQLSCYLLAFQLLLVTLHVESTDNPTDEGSRKMGRAENSGRTA